MVVKDETPSLNPTPNASLPCSVCDNDHHNSTPNDSSFTDDSITSKRKPKWFEILIQESDDYLARMDKLKARRINYCNYALMSIIMNENDPRFF